MFLIITGALVGGAVSGWNPLGLLIGACIGWWMSKGFGGARRSAHTAGRGAGENDFMYILIAILAKMTKADGVISRNEIKTVSMLFDRMNIRGDSLKLAKEIFRREKDSAVTVEDYIRRFRHATNSDPQLSEMLYYCLNQLARADGDISPAARDILNTAERELNLDHAHAESVNKSDGALSRREAAEVLEVAPDADEAEITAAYRRKCNQMHPDKLVSKGLPKEMIAFAESQLAKYNEARDILLS